MNGVARKTNIVFPVRANLGDDAYKYQKSNMERG